MSGADAKRRVQTRRDMRLLWNVLETKGGLDLQGAVDYLAVQKVTWPVPALRQHAQRCMAWIVALAGDQVKVYAWLDDLPVGIVKASYGKLRSREMDLFLSN